MRPICIATSPWQRLWIRGLSRLSTSRLRLSHSATDSPIRPFSCMSVLPSSSTFRVELSFTASAMASRPSSPMGLPLRFSTCRPPPPPDLDASASASFMPPSLPMLLPARLRYFREVFLRRRLASDVAPASSIKLKDRSIASMSLSSARASVRAKSCMYWIRLLNRSLLFPRRSKDRSTPSESAASCIWATAGAMSSQWKSLLLDS
mmetsp:Transcript_22536/g.58770  ORF Transcript_22536/g.58770 Transcript_22536/m.58770 type:complete len:206 (+) Transcript_22536:642-1259(+)